MSETEPEAVEVVEVVDPSDDDAQPHSENDEHTGDDEAWETGDPDADASAAEQE